MTRHSHGDMGLSARSNGLARYGTCQPDLMEHPRTHISRQNLRVSKIRNMQCGMAQEKGSSRESENSAHRMTMFISGLDYHLSIP